MNKILLICLTISISTLTINAETLAFDEKQNINKIHYGQTILEINCKENVVIQQVTLHKDTQKKNGKHCIKKGSSKKNLQKYVLKVQK
jgi:hypothetical protein